MSTTLESETQVRARGGLHLTFKLGEETYGLEILKVQEIIGIMAITHVPKTPAFVRGVLNLRGKVIAVIDLRLKFEMPLQADTERTCVVVVQVLDANKTVTMGIIVDEVSEVLEVSASQIEPPPSFGASVDTDFIMGMGKVGDRLVILLDVQRVLGTDELLMLDALQREE